MVLDGKRQYAREQLEKGLSALRGSSGDFYDRVFAASDNLLRVDYTHFADEPHRRATWNSDLRPVIVKVVQAIRSSEPASEAIPPSDAGAFEERLVVFITTYLHGDHLPGAGPLAAD